MTFNFYKHESASNSSNYDDGHEVHNLPPTITEYQNNHLNKDYNNNIDNLDDDSIKFKNKIKAPLANNNNNNSRLFYYGLADSYVNGRDYIRPDKEIEKEKDDEKKIQWSNNAEYGIKTFNNKRVNKKYANVIKVINERENTNGEYYIVSYDVYILEDNFKFVNKNIMFSNGKNIDDKYINIDEVNNIMNRIIEDKNKFEIFVDIANKCENKEYNINDNLFIKNIVDNFGVNIWNDIYKNYKYEESDLYNKSYVPTHSF